MPVASPAPQSPVVGNREAVVIARGDGNKFFIRSNAFAFHSTA